MKKLFGLVLALGLLVSIAQAADLQSVSEFESGQLYKAGQINVVVMKGNFYQMGRQYGALVKNEINEFYDLATKQIGLGTDKAPYDEVLAEMKKGLAAAPFYVREWVRGMGETSGLGADKQIIACQALGPIVMGEGSCSGLIVWGDYTKNGAAIAGRNWDLGTKALAPYQKFLTVAVFNPTGSGQGVADINYVGQIMWQSALNQSGLFYDLQNGGMSDPNSAKNRLNSNCALMSMMLDSTSFEQADAFFDAVRAQGGLLINVAGPTQGACYEWGTADYRRRVDDEKGMVAAANNFIDPTWHVTRSLPPGAPAGFTIERCSNLAALAKKNKGRIDVNKMKEFFDATIPQGGPTFYPGSGLKTYYTIVAAPKELKLWLNVRDLQDWTEIDLKPLFSSSASNML
ncbi:MAG: C45 family autoproteolytic acyltransferase/hydrolase [Candidatus Margulisbacteria bacterium]|nr:C45 family autoproteolytic acyltransferase/hydrolase [Candidatus Margulisiibacteriota bacterium]